MEIKEVKFIKGITGTDPILKSKRPQFAFIGRSNVGKSSLINKLLGQKNLVKTSAQPGKTKEINFFLVNKKIYFVDLPGYGFAKMSQKQREKMRKMILWYFISGEPKINKVILIIDAKAGLKEFDREMIAVLQEYAPKYNYDFLIAVNKIDKLSQKKLHKSLTIIKQELKNEKKIVPVSAKTGRGVPKLSETIFAK